MKIVFLLLLVIGLFNMVLCDNNSTCDIQLSCGECTSSTDCVWCENEKICKQLKGDLIKHQQCKDWRYRQCKVNGMFLVYGSLGVVGTLILCLCACCCYCCFCRSKPNTNRTAQDWQDDDFRSVNSLDRIERKPLVSDRYNNPDRRERIDRIRQKYAREKSVLNEFE